MSVTKYKDPVTGEWVASTTSGSDGAPGKSAYEYAKEAGYTGTEEEFARKLAEEAPKAFYVTINDNGDGGEVSDKTFTEVYNAYQNGRVIYAVLGYFNNITLPVLMVNEDVAGFGATAGNAIVTVMLDSSNTVSSIFEPILSSDDVSVMIDTKLGVIENGSY